jgi:periplasmic protein TonB
MSAPVAGKEKNQAGAAIVFHFGSEKIATRPSAPALDNVEYRKYSLAAGNWGGIPVSKRPLRYVPIEEAEETFLRGLLDTPTDHPQKNLADWLVSLALHILIVGALVIAPLAFTQAIDMRALQLTYLTVPKPPAAAPPPPPATQPAVKRILRAIQTAQLTAPVAIPKRVALVKDENLSDPAGVIGGIPGGESGGVLGGILGGLQSGPAAPPPPPAAKKIIYRVGGDVKPPRQISVVQPDYPPIARAARTEGVVVINAIIDEHGDVVEARAVSGPGLLISSALRAVMQWKYEPTYLDGTPVPIRMEVQVYFHLH